MIALRPHSRKLMSMSHSSAVRRTLALSSLFALLVGCASGPSGDRGPRGGSTSTSSEGGNGTSGSNGPGSGGSGVNFGMGGGTSTGSGGDGTAGVTCAATSESAKLIPLDLYVMMDSSKSMNEPTSTGATKWKAVTDALKAFFTDANSAGLNIGLKFFPDEQAIPGECSMDSECGSFGPCDQRKACVGKNTFSKVVTTLCTDDTGCAATEVCRPVSRCNDGANCAKTYCVADGTGACPSDCKVFTGYCRERDVCTAANYATPAVPFGALPDAASALSTALTARMPDGYTPTGPALSGALQQARDRAKANPGHKVAVILVTDGLPGGFIPNKPPVSCMPGDIAGVANVVAMGNMASADAPAIQTFVIGVFGPCDLVDQNVMPAANLDKLAMSGGTNKAVVISTDQNVQQQLQDALKQVRTAAIACQYAVPKSDSGTVDLMKVNVKFNSASTGSSTVYYVATKDKCDASKGGWYYDQDPANGGKPTQIVVCEKSCSDFQAKQDARVDIALGCKTEVPL